MRDELVIALDVGGTHGRVALLQMQSSGVQILKQQRLEIPAEFESGIAALIETIQQVAGEYPIAKVGAAFPGDLDAARTMIVSSTNLPRWQNQPIKERLQAVLPYPVTLFHDVAAAAAGEAQSGAGTDLSSFVFMIWGTGLAGAKVERLGEALHISAFDAGHVPLDVSGMVCVCGQRGCPEATIGGGALRAKHGDMNLISDSDPLWDAVVETATQMICQTQIFHPTSTIIFGGGVILKRPFLLERIQVNIHQQLKAVPVPTLQLTELGDDTGLYGIANLLSTPSI